MARAFQERQAREHSPRKARLTDDDGAYGSGREILPYRPTCRLQPGTPAYIPCKRDIAKARGKAPKTQTLFLVALRLAPRTIVALALASNGFPRASPCRRDTSRPSPPYGICRFRRILMPRHRVLARVGRKAWYCWKATCAIGKASSAHRAGRGPL